MSDSLVAAVWAALPGMVASDLPVGDCMGKVASLAEEHDPGAGWDRFRALDYGASVAGLQSWIPDALQRSPPPRLPLNGLFIPLFQLGDDTSPLKTETCSPCYSALRLAGTSTYFADDLRWLNDQCYTPSLELEEGHAPVLLEISRIAHEENASSMDTSFWMDWAMPLAFAVTTVRSLLTPHTSRLVNPEADVVGIVVGWEDGDFFEIGQLTPEGFRPQRPEL